MGAIVDHDDLNKMNLELEVVIKQEQNDLEEGEVTSKNSPVKKKKNAKVKKKIACQDSGQFSRDGEIWPSIRETSMGMYILFHATNVEKPLINFLSISNIDIEANNTMKINN